MSFRRLILTGVAVAIGSGVLFGAWSVYFSTIQVRVATIQRDVPVEVFGLGTVEARVTSKIGFKVSGVLVELRADVGDRVAKGALLARLDDREQTARTGRAQAATEQAEANLQKAMASVEKAKANHANAKTSMSAGKNWFKRILLQSNRLRRQRPHKTPPLLT